MKKFVKPVKKVVNRQEPVKAKKILIYPDNGSVRFQVRLDKNGQIYDINRSLLISIKDEETGKRKMQVTIGERPRLLYDKIKGRPFKIAQPWIDEEVAFILNNPE